MPTPTTANTKTVTTNVSPAMNATLLTTLLAKPIELLSIAELKIIVDSTKRSAAGSNPASLIGACLP
jgi:hypothetical protein